MQNVWALAAIWVGLALIATLIAIWFKISTALSEIVVGTVAQLVMGAFLAKANLGARTECSEYAPNCNKFLGATTKHNIRPVIRNFNDSFRFQFRFAARRVVAC